MREYMDRGNDMETAGNWFVIDYGALYTMKIKALSPANRNISSIL